MRAAACSRNIPPARYELTARLPGFRSITETVDLSRGGEQQISLVMQVGGLQESVTVTCGPALLDSAAPAHLFSRPTDAARRRGSSPSRRPRSAPIRVGGQIAAPRQVSHGPPDGPAGVAPGGSYVVILEATIGADGWVQDIVSLRPRTSDAQTGPFVQAAMEAVSQWQVHADAAE